MSRYQRSAAEEAERALSALKHLDAGVGRVDWVHYSIAAKAAGISYDDWLAWCETGANFSGEADCRSVWKGITEKGAAGPGKLFALALEQGWETPKDERERSVPAASRSLPHPHPRAGRSAQPPAGGGRGSSGGRTATGAGRRDETPEQARRRAQEMAQRRDALWQAGVPADHLHAYLVRKSMPATNLRQLEIQSVARLLEYTPEAGGEPLSGTCLMVPLRDVRGELVQIELIDEAGRKTVLARLPRKATFWTQDHSALDERVFMIGVAEGAATTATLEEAAGHPVVAAGSWGNMPAVAEALAKAFPRAEIVLYPDRGEKQEEQASAIALSLLGRSVPLPSRCPEGWDYNDLMDAEGIQAVRTWLGPRLSAPGYRVSFSVALQQGRIEIDELLPGLPRGTVGLLVGQGAVGKTMLALEVGAGLALGRDLTFSAGMGKPNFLCPAKATPRRVALVLGEDSYTQIHNRLVDMADAFNLSSKDLALLDTNLLLLTLDGCDLRVVTLGDGKRPEPGPLLPTIDRLGRWADLMAIDPLVRLHDSDENDNTAASALMLGLSRITKVRDCAIVLLHHVPKAQSVGKGDWRSSRGAAAYSTSARWQVLVSPADDGAGSASPNEIHLALVKHNYCAPWPRFGLERKHGGVLIYTPTSQPADAKTGGHTAFAAAAGKVAVQRPSAAALGKGWPTDYEIDDGRDLP